MVPWDSNRAKKFLSPNDIITGGPSVKWSTWHQCFLLVSAYWESCSSLEMPGALSWSPGSFPQTSPPSKPRSKFNPPCVPYYNCKMPLGNNYKGALKKKSLLQYLQVRGRIRKAKRYTPKSWVGRVPIDLGFCFYWGGAWRLRISWAHSLLVNLKLKSRNWKHPT